MADRNIVIHLSPEQEHARRLITQAQLADSLDEYRPHELVQMVRSGVRARRSVELCILAGSPPAEDTGSSLAVAAVLFLRPRTVVTVDTSTDRITRIPVGRFLAERAPGAAAQLALSAASVIAQRVLAEGLVRARQSTPRRRPPAGLAEVVYLFPVAGTGSAIGGAATHAHGVIRGLRSHGIRVAPVTTNRALARSLRGDARDVGWIETTIPRLARAVPASSALAGDLALAMAALRFARGADMIYQRHLRFSICGALLAKLTGTPLFLEFNGRGSFMVPDPRLFAAQLQRCEEAAFRVAERVIVVSEVERTRLEGIGLDPDRIVVVPNGVEPDRFASADGAETRRRLGMRSGARVIGFLGTFGPWHGATILAEAFAALSRERPDVRLLLLGDGAERGAVERLLSAHGVAERTTITGRVPSGQVPAYLDACDILVSPHVPLPNGEAFFGSPTKLFEYMAAGKPIVASRLGQIADVLDHERTALLVTPGSVEELATAIARLLDDRRLAGSIGRRAREAARTKHTWDQSVSQVIDSYRDALARES